MAQTVTSRRLRMSYEEYEAWVNEDTHSEWVDGEVTVFMASTPRHQAIKNLLASLLTFYVALRRLGQVLDAPVEMRLRAGRSYREPDILFLATDHLDRIAAKRIDGPADFVIEVLSEDDPDRDRVEKFNEYAEAGIPEYWIVEGREGRTGVDAYRLGPDGRYVPIALAPDGRLFSLTVPGFWVDPAWLASDPLPNVAECFARIVPGAFASGS
jgi:Uma2 family endonuclease